MTCQDKIEDVLYSINECSTSYHYRAAVVGDTLQGAAKALQSLGKSEDPPSAAPPAGASPKLVFVFSGMGTQVPEMLEKLGTDPSVRQMIGDITRRLRELGADYDLSQILRDRSKLISEDMEIAQVAIFTFQLCLSQWFRQRGVVPDVCLGHSVGEVAAFHVAGRLSFEDAVQVIYLRASALKKHAGSGKMIALMMDAERGEQAIKLSNADLDLAALNSSECVVVSGNSDEVEKLQMYLKSSMQEGRMLDNINVGFHSKCVDPAPLA